MKKVNCIKVLAPQRSGTNYMEELIRRNFDVPTCRDTVDPMLAPYMKHARIGTYPNAPEEMKRDNVGVILIRKRFDFWIESVKRKPCGIQKDFPQLWYPNAAARNREKVLAFHRNWYHNWEAGLVRAEVPYLYVEYLDLLKDLDREMSRIQKRFGVEKTGEHWNNPELVKASPLFNRQRREYYLKGIAG